MASMRMSVSRIASAPAVFAAGVFFLAGLHPSDANAQASYTLPASIAQSGTVNVGTSLQWPPYVFRDEAGNPAGFDIELVNSLADELGVKVNITAVQFPAIIPGLQSGRFDLAVNEIFDTVARQEIVDLVDYLNVGLTVLVAGDPSEYSVDDLCGHSVALTAGTAQIAHAEKLSSECEAKGKQPIGMVELPDSAQGMTAVASGRADFLFADSAVGKYIEETTGTLKAVPGTVPGTRGLVGIAVAKGNAELAGALQGALEALIEDGRYGELLDKYGLGDSGVEKVTVNGTK